MPLASPVDTLTRARLIIDGNTVEVPAGATVLDAATRAPDPASTASQRWTVVDLPSVPVTPTQRGAPDRRPTCVEVPAGGPPIPRQTGGYTGG